MDYTENAIRYIGATTHLTDILQGLKDYLDKLFKKVDFNQVFREWGKGRGYYGWRGARYFLFEHEQWLQSQSKTNRDKLSWEEFSKEDYANDYYTLEHIYPQKVSYDCWRSPFAQYSIKQRNVLRNSIGNLVPLSKPKNSSLRNKCFDGKKGDHENKIGYAYGCYSENEIAQERVWTAREILMRGIRLLEFMEHRWGVPLGDRRAKVKALGLDFVLTKESGISL